MTPDRRLDQLEPLMADALLKIDRLIEGQGQLFDLAVNTKIELDEVKIQLGAVKATGEATAARLETVRITGEATAAELAQVKATGEATAALLDQVKLTSETSATELGQVKTMGETTARAVANLTVTTQRQFDELKAGQDIILQILREKLP